MAQDVHAVESMPAYGINRSMNDVYMMYLIAFTEARGRAEVGFVAPAECTEEQRVAVALGVSDGKGSCPPDSRAKLRCRVDAMIA
jgi:hypothetical protein